MKSIFICVPGKAVPKGRPRAKRVGRSVRMYTPPKTKEYEEVVAIESKIAMIGTKTFEGAVEVRLQVFVPIPARYNKAKKEACRLGKIYPTSTSDLDNICKSVLDAMNGIVFLDDSQVVDAHLTKRYSDEPCVMVQVTPLTD